mgnify:CR=1 FL=1
MSMKTTGTTEAQRRVLAAVLGGEPGDALREFSGGFGLRNSTRAFDACERRGWIRREQDDAYTITEAGRATLARAR